MCLSLVPDGTKKPVIIQVLYEKGAEKNNLNKETREN